MALIPEIKISQFLEKCLDTPEEVKKMPSSILTDDEGNYLATLIIPRTDYIRYKTEYIGELSNSVRTKEG